MSLAHPGDGARRHSVPEAQELAVDALVPPGRVAGGHLHDESGKLLWDGGSSGRAVGIGAVFDDEASVPARQRLGSHAERRPPLPRQEPAQGCQPGPIAGAHDEHHERQHTSDNEVEERPQLGTGRIGLAHGDGAP